MTADPTTDAMVTAAEMALTCFALMLSFGADRTAGIEALRDDQLRPALHAAISTGSGFLLTLADLGRKDPNMMIERLSDGYRHVLATRGTCRCPEMCGPLAAAT